MKTKRIIYFTMILTGAIIMAAGENLMQKEYALCIGIVLLMFGIYKSTQIWQPPNPPNDKQKNDQI